MIQRNDEGLGFIVVAGVWDGLPSVAAALSNGTKSGDPVRAGKVQNKT
jgi:hypothetical protein